MPKIPQKIPSKTTDDYWIYAERKKGKYPKHTARGGKWLIFISNQNIDAAWLKIKTALEEGKLGGIAKAATAKYNHQYPNSETKVICVYTYDWQDEQDVKIIREGLRELGIVRKIAYKTDEDTDKRKYCNIGTREISKYYE